MRNLAFTPEAIGGGVVQRAFTSREHLFRSGDRISGDDLRAMPISNMRALVENRFIELFPIDLPQERFIVQTGKDTFDVIAGHRLNHEPLSRLVADKLAGNQPQN